MPEIKITEIDNTVGTISEEDYVVFVPGNVGSNDQDVKDGDKQYEYIGKTTLFNTLDEFKLAIGNNVPTYDDVDTPFTINDVTYDPGYLTAKFLLGKGYKVYYRVPEGDETTTTNKDYGTPKINQDLTKYYSTETNIGEPTKSSSGIYSEITVQLSEIDTDGSFTSTIETSAAAITDATTEEINSFNTTGSFTRNSIVYDKCKGTTQTNTTTTTTTYAISSYADMQTAINNEDFYKDLDDKSLYQVRFLTNGGYVISDATEGPNETDITSLTTLINIATTRGDCIVLVDHDYELNTQEDITAAATKVSSKYAAMFSPWCKYAIANNNINLNIQMPGSLAYLEAFINGVKTNPTWYAMAGRLRGTITGKPILNYGEKFANSLMVDAGVSVNPITYVYPFGLLIWGNRTTFDSTSKKGLVASSFLNIRQLVVDLFKTLYINAKGYMFEQNSDRLWFNFKNDIEKLLNNMKTGQGIEASKIYRLDTTKEKVRALIRIVPEYAVEKFDLTVELTDTINVNESE